VEIVVAVLWLYTYQIWKLANNFFRIYLIFLDFKKSHDLCNVAVLFPNLVTSKKILSDFSDLFYFIEGHMTHIWWLCFIESSPSSTADHMDSCPV